MEYKHIKPDVVIQEKLVAAAHEAHVRAAMAEIHQEQFLRLQSHESPHVKLVAQNQFSEHQKWAVKHRRAAERKTAVAKIPQSDLIATEQAELKRYLTQLENEHLDNKIKSDDLAEARANDELDDADVFQQTEKGPLTVGDQAYVYTVNLAVIEAAHQVASERLAALSETETE